MTRRDSRDGTKTMTRYKHETDILVPHRIYIPLALCVVNDVSPIFSFCNLRLDRAPAAKHTLAVRHTMLPIVPVRSSQASAVQSVRKIKNRRHNNSSKIGASQARIPSSHPQDQSALSCGSFRGGCKAGHLPNCVAVCPPVCQRGIVIPVSYHGRARQQRYGCDRPVVQAVSRQRRVWRVTAAQAHSVVAAEAHGSTRKHGGEEASPSCAPFPAAMPCAAAGISWPALFYLELVQAIAPYRFSASDCLPRCRRCVR